MKEYRQDSHAASLAIWALLCTGAAVYFFLHSGKVMSRLLQIEEILAGTALLLAGPLTLAIYLYRARHIWVGVVPDEGIVVGGRGIIPWDEILRIERRKPFFRKRSGPVEPAAFPLSGKTLKDCCSDIGCSGIMLGEGCLLAIGLGLLILTVLFLFWLLIGVLIPLIAVPLLEIFAPFGDRIRIVTRSRTLVLRDLRDADGFVREVTPRMPVQEV